MREAFTWSLIAAVNDEEVLHGTLLRSPDLDECCEVILKRGYSSAGKAYNAGLDEATRELLVFAHQDVYLPPRWTAQLETAVEELSRLDSAWGVLGVYGIARSGEPFGYVHSAGLARTLGKPFERAVEAHTLDELLLVMRQSSALRFDELLPGFHLYGTGICLQAAKLGMRNYVIPAFCIHNSNGIRRLPMAFWKAYLYLRRKWWDRLPVVTSCTVITKAAWPMVRGLSWDTIRGPFRTDRPKTRCEDPQQLYSDLMKTVPISESGDGAAAGNSRVR